jgi:hypothetical protein
MPSRLSLIADTVLSNTLVGFLMITGGLIVASGGIVVLMRRPPESPVVTNLSPKSNPTPAHTSAKVAEPLKPADRGTEFEKWVVQRFSRDFFKIKEWRGDKYVDGSYAESSLNPDLEIEFYMGEIRKPFAVECKWRQGYDQGVKPYIEWASDRQIENYRNFAQTKAVPVFVVIGIGGEPNNPADVFVVNLNSLRYPKATAEYLAPFRRKNKEHGFYFDYESPALK